MEPHGFLELKWSGDTLYVNAVGPFNDEGAKAAAEAYIRAVRNKPSPTFSVIEILDPDSVGPPDTMDEVEKTWTFLGDEGCTALALVYANAVQRELAEKHLPAFGRAFSTIEDAENWIRKQGPGR